MFLCWTLSGGWNQQPESWGHRWNGLQKSTIPRHRETNVVLGKFSAWCVSKLWGKIMVEKIMFSEGLETLVQFRLQGSLPKRRAVEPVALEASPEVPNSGLRFGEKKPIFKPTYYVRHINAMQCHVWSWMWCNGMKRNVCRDIMGYTASSNRNCLGMRAVHPIYGNQTSDFLNYDILGVSHKFQTSIDCWCQ